MSTASTVQTSPARLQPRQPRLQGQVAVITGGNQGLGKAIARAFAREGADLVIAARTRDTLLTSAQELRDEGATVTAVPCDVGSEEDIIRLFAEAEAAFGRIDILVNNAAIAGPTRPVLEMDTAEWEQCLRVDLTGQMICAREALKRMVPAQKGVIINIGTVFAKRPYPLRTAYAAAKAGLISLTQTLAWEVGQNGIRVNCILPGPVEGERIDRVWKARAEVRGIPVEKLREKMLSMSAMRRIPTPDEVASLAVFLASDESSAMTGQSINLTCGMETR